MCIYSRNFIFNSYINCDILTYKNELQQTRERRKREKKKGGSSRNTITLHNHQRLNYSKAMFRRTLKGRRAVDWLRV